MEQKITIACIIGPKFCVPNGIHKLIREQENTQAHRQDYFMFYAIDSVYFFNFRLTNIDSSIYKLIKTITHIYIYIYSVLL